MGQLQYATDYQPNGIATYRYKYYYDNAGNLTSWKIQDDSGTVTKVSHTYTYGDSDWLDLLTAFDGETITYDGAGNPLSYYNGSRYTMTWKHGRQLASATVGGKTYSYQYDADGIRTRKTNFDGGYTEYYVVEGLPVAEQRFTAAGAKLYILQYLYDESNNAVGFGIYYPTDTSPNWQYYYFGKNIQGDVIALYRSDYNSSNGTYSPTLVATYSYDPWGTPTGIYDANGAAISQTADHVAAYNPFRYRGYHYDGDTRLYYLQSRYYDPATGRFVNADGYTSTGQGLVGHNMFAYCGNNPVIRKDSSGELWMAVASSALLGGIGGVVTALAAGDNPVIGFAVGAVTSGASTLFGFGEIGSAIATGVMGAYTSVLGNIFEQSANQREINWGEVLLSAGTGFVNGAVESLIGKGMASAVLECSVANLVVDTVTSALTTANTVTANAYYGALRTNGTSNSNSKPRYINRWSSQTYVRTQQRYGRKLPKRYTTRQRVM